IPRMHPPPRTHPTSRLHPRSRPSPPRRGSRMIPAAPLRRLRGSHPPRRPAVRVVRLAPSHGPLRFAAASPNPPSTGSGGRPPSPRVNATRNPIPPLSPHTGRLQGNWVTCVPLPSPHDADPTNLSPPALRTILCHGPQWSHGYQRREHRPQL